jgi:hypothetical protein
MQGQQATARAIDPKQIPGWGVDSDPENDPTYPMKSHTEGEHDGYNWERPEQQRAEVEVLHSTERPNLPATFGTSLPPSGLSGVIRRAAFNFSENSYGHWLPLMVADRVEMIEGLASDLAKGHIPNIFGELGWKAEWKHNRKALITKAAVGTGIAVALGVLLMSRKRPEQAKEGTTDRIDYRLH